jgi:hypothetical protein
MYCLYCDLAQLVGLGYNLWVIAYPIVDILIILFIGRQALFLHSTFASMRFNMTSSARALAV